MKLAELFITEEKIVQAAFKDPRTGNVYPTGQMHDMEVVMKEFGFDPDNENDWEEFTKIYNTLVNGFITDKGRFFNRQEAAKLVGSSEERLSTELVKGMGPNLHWQHRGVDPEIKESIFKDSGTGWIYADAERFIKQISNVVQQSGFDITLIGSVKNKGKSENDLDLLLIPQHKNHDIEMLMYGFDNMGFSQDQVRDDLLMLELPNGKHVDLFIQDYIY